ncbi:endonuclease/exonuclease/phosphatase family protein [Oceanispirochaeta crateris]|uniref:Endonuclease/exonuclease/phosphatase family protein n=1 Tax=Oceanispirochaeta crateris TaxID=2518645 RepID=A0A5C1QQM5_9SPIO|nr:endonuclease/exonuclease/phosphatase family protein [Oceanispirochaeta crateris]QEN09519.1 endonuclease/exonuclease/phosphatase family protein [Oceanispirochaeta crateris]
MKSFFIIVLFLQSLISVWGEKSDSIRLTTFNVHYLYAGHDKMNWDDRKEAVLQVITESDPDIISFQEMETFTRSQENDQNIQLSYLQMNLSDYGTAAVGPAADFPITQPILFKKDRFESRNQGFFFFSETPDQIYSRTWNGSYPAYCVWIDLYDSQRQETFRVYNMHNDYKSRNNRIKSSLLILEKMQSWLDDKKPLILMGDFNALSWQQPVSLFQNAGLLIGKTRGSSFHFNRGLNLFPAIDHILFTPHFQQKSNQIIRKRYDGVFPSDHYPVTVEIY